MTTMSDRLRQEAADHDQAAADSFDRCDTDGFLTQWAHGLSAERKRRQAQIQDEGGTAVFPALFDLAGNLVAAKLLVIEDKFKGYGTRTVWAVLENDDPDSKVVQWVTAFPARTSTMTNKGFREGHVRAAAKAVTWAPPGARGLGGATQVQVIDQRTDGGFSRDVEIID